MSKKIYYILSIIDLLLIFVVSFCGLFVPSIYNTKNSDLSIPMIMGQDLISVIVGFIMAVSIYLTFKGSIRGLILRLGCLAYFIYSYAYYSFSGITTIFYILYIGIFSLSLFSFIGLLLDTDIKLFLKSVNKKIPRIAVSLFLIFCVVFVGTLEIFNIINSMLNNNINSIKSKDTFVVLDLGLLFPAIFIGAVMSLKKNIWGLFLSGIFLIKTATLLPAIISSDIFSLIYSGKLTDMNFDIISFVFTLIAIVLSYFYFSNISEVK